METSICLNCPILSSCQFKHTNPKKCLHKPAPIGVNVSEAISNWGRKKILFAGKDYDLGRVARDEHVIRMGMCEGAWD